MLGCAAGPTLSHAANLWHSNCIDAALHGAIKALAIATAATAARRAVSQRGAPLRGMVEGLSADSCRRVQSSLAELGPICKIGLADTPR